MVDIQVSNEELNLLMAALVNYRQRGFPMGKSSPGNPISYKDRREWAHLGMEVYGKLLISSKEKEGE